MWKKILVGVIVLIVAVVGLAFWATSGLTDTASAFFNKVKAHDYKTAYYGYLSDDFKGNVPLETFQAFMETNHLDRFKDISWGNREVENGKGKLEGTLVMPDGSSIPINVMFVKGEDGWKIYAVTKPAAGIRETQSEEKNKQVSKLTIPSKQAYMALARETVRNVATTLESKNTDMLYNTISSVWRSQITPDKFHQIFEGLMQSKTNLTPLVNMVPKEEKPAFLDENNILHVSINYPVQPVNILFDLDYINEGGEWKLFGINIHGK